MTMTEPGGSAAPSPATDDDRLGQIETLVRRVRAGELDEDAALSRIATLAKSHDGGEVYQKPWG